MKSSQCQRPSPSLTSFPSIYAQLVSKSSWWRRTRNPAPFLPHFISLARFILCFYRIYGKIRGFSKTVNLRNSSTAYHRNTFHTALCKKPGLQLCFFLFSTYIVIWLSPCLTVRAKYFLNWVSHNIMLILLRKNVISTYIGCNTMNMTKVSSYFAFDYLQNETNLNFVICFQREARFLMINVVFCLLSSNALQTKLPWSSVYATNYYLQTTQLPTP